MSSVMCCVTRQAVAGHLPGARWQGDSILQNADRADPSHMAPSSQGYYSMALPQQPGPWPLPDTLLSHLFQVLLAAGNSDIFRIQCLKSETLHQWFCFSFVFRPLHLNHHQTHHNGRHQEEDAGYEAWEGQCYGQGRRLRTAGQGRQPQSREGKLLDFSCIKRKEKNLFSKKCCKIDPYWKM